MTSKRPCSFIPR